MNLNWKDIPGFEGLYQVNPLGEIKSLEKRWITGRGNGRAHIQPEKIIKPFISNFGYYRVSLSKAGKYKKLHVHTVVAMSYIPNPFNKSQVNHKDGNKLNNTVENLEWNTPSENMQHAFDNGLNYTSDKKRKVLSKRHSGGKNVNAKAVIDTSTGRRYECINDAAKDLGISAHNLYAYLRGANPNKTSIRYA